MTIDTTTESTLTIFPHSIDVRQTERSPSATKVSPADDAKGVLASKDSTDGALNTKRLEKAVDEVNQRFQQQQRTLQFTIQQSTGRMVVSVFDSTTDKLIRQIPSEDVLALAEHMEEMSESDIGIVLQDQA